jgi:hypothetical protein
VKWRRRTHGAVAILSAVLAVPAFLWWKDSILFVIGLSLFANFYAAVSALEAADDSAVLSGLAEIKAMLSER